MDNANTSVYYDGNDISDLDGVIIYDHDFNEMPSRSLKVNKLAHADKSILTSAEYDTKSVTIQGFVDDCDRYDAEDGFINLKSYLQRPNRVLQVLNGSNTIEYQKATLNGIAKQWVHNKIKFTLEFICADPIGINATISSLGTTNNTAASTNISLDFEGSFKAQPIITATLNTVSGATAQAMTFRNSLTGQSIAITRTWANADIVEIDSADFTVTVNGTVTDFTGTFLNFDPGVQTLEYLDTFTTRDIDIAVSYYKRFI